MKSISLLALLSATAYGYQDVRSNLEGRRIVEIDAADMHIFQELHGDQSDFLHQKEGKASVIVPEGVVLDTKVNINDVTDAWVDQLQENFDSPDLFCAESSEVCAARNTQDFFSSYQSLAAITARIEGLVDASPLAKKVVIGKSFEGRDMNLIEIGDQSKPLAYFMCNIHAREWLSVMYCPYMIEMLLADGGHRVLDTFSFAIIPTGNPDGYEYSRTVNSFWRKTRATNPGSSCIGTDPNRNYENNHCGPGTSNNPCSDIYCGTAPYSTNEVNAVNEYAKANANRMITWIDFHAYASMWLSPLGYARGVPPAVDYDRMLKCMNAAKDAIRAETGTRYRVGGAADLLGAAAGASDDNFYFTYGVIYSFTVEMRGNSFQPSTSNISPNNRELFAGMIAQMDCIAETELGAETVGEPETSESKKLSETGVALVVIPVVLAFSILLAVGVDKYRNKKKVESVQGDVVQATL